MSGTWEANCVAKDLCMRCGKSRVSTAGYTKTRCAPCAETERNAARLKYRSKVGTPHDAPKHDKHKPPTHYGSLSLDDIRRATSALPLKPPGK